jgi:enoyl-CoA hydratase
MDEIRYRVDEGVAIVTVDAPDRRNAFTPELVSSLRDTLSRAVADPQIGALVLAAEGPSFCAGADLRVLRAAMADPLDDQAFETLGQIYELFRDLVKLPLPTVAAVQGPAIGAGVNLALACDLRVLAEEAEFVGFGRAGVHPGGGHLELLRSIDRQTAAWLALFNQAIPASEAVAMGLAVKVTSRDELMGDVMTIARGAASNPALSRMVTSTFRTIDGADARHGNAVKVERAPQLWSLRRLQG